MGLDLPCEPVAGGILTLSAGVKVQQCTGTLTA